MEPQTRPSGTPAIDPDLMKKIRIALVALGVVAVAVVAYFVLRVVRSEEKASRWDDLARIAATYEPTDISQDPLFESPGGTYRTRRDRYIAALESFLKEIGTEDPALTAHVHWLVAKVSTDQAISMKDVVDVETRKKHWARARDHVRTLLTDFPDFQANWTPFAPAGQATLLRGFLETLEKNIAWEERNLPREQPPQEDTVVVLRTERGDLRIGLYSDLAPDLTSRFVAHALAGDYDGTAFFARLDTGSAGTREAAIRGGSPSTRGAEPYARSAHAAFLEPEFTEPVAAAPTRWRIPATRGVVLAWHPPTDEYDGSQQILVVANRSAMYDYRYSAIGRLLDDASLESVDRIFTSPTWGSQGSDTGAEDVEGIEDVLQVPVQIVKALVFRGDALVEPETAPGPHRVGPAEAERTLSGLERDAYRAEPPERPGTGEGATPPEEPGSDSPPGEGEGEGEGTGPEEDAGSDPGSGG